MAWSPFLTNLRDVLASLYPIVNMSVVVVQDAGLNPAFIAFDNRAITNWHNILAEADKRGKVGAIVETARKDYPENVWLQNAARNDLNAASGADIAKHVDWQEPADLSQLEKIMGARSTLLDILFLEKGTITARAVARILMPGGSGSGFLTTDGLLITNNHVLPDAATAAAARAQFNYQKTLAGLDAPTDEYALDPDSGFATSREDDWSAVRLKGDPAAKWGALTLQPATVAKDDTINIIQHPGGGPKQIALYHNIVTYADARIVQYLTDTLPGSSGSPCFNDNWDLVALHHSGGWLREPNSKDALYRNEGIHINRVIEGVRQAGLLAANAGSAHANNAGGNENRGS
jgi:V8-like Glu-specific endopeptidase